jgi:hypothetical protein
MDSNFHCAHCNVPLHKIKDYLVVSGIVTPYCQAPECQQSKQQQATWYVKYGLRVKEGTDID